MKIRLVDAKIALKILSEEELETFAKFLFLFKSDAIVKNSLDHRS